MFSGPGKGSDPPTEKPTFEDRWASVLPYGATIMGGPSASVTIVELTDLECPACRGYHSRLRDLVERHEGRVRVVYVPYPLTSIHRFALAAAQAGDCALDDSPDALRRWIETVYAGQDSLGLRSWGAYAAAAGIADTAAIANCARTPIPRERVVSWWWATSNHRSAIVVGLCGVVAFGCTRKPDSRWDDAPPGVDVVTNTAFATAPTEYLLHDAADWGVGGPGASPEEEFDLTQGALTAAVLSDGGVVVSEQSRIHFFDSLGRHRAVVGRVGSGPGEFNYINATCRTQGDTIVVEDVNNARLVIVDALAPAIVRTIPNQIGRLPQQGCLEDGTFVVAGATVDRETQVRALAYRRVRLDGSEISTLLASERSRDVTRQVGMPKHAASGANWYFADPYFSEFRTFDITGRLVRITRVEQPLREIPRLQALAAEGIAPAAGNATTPRTDAMVREPFFGRMIASPDGSVWLNELRAPEVTQDVWHRFDTDGRLRGTLRIPMQATGQLLYVLDLSDSGVVMRRDDENGYAWIERYQFREESR
ncbi:MAG: thioredoxin domain-containing protein [Thioalkalivibrio sp.]|nr:thioredoxin domain-containing protein [Thioalkalivibrio sp.]